MIARKHLMVFFSSNQCGVIKVHVCWTAVVILFKVEVRDNTVRSRFLYLFRGPQQNR